MLFAAFPRNPPSRGQARAKTTTLTTRTAARQAWSRITGVWLVVLALHLGPGCSAEGTAAPTTLGPYQDRPGDCPQTATYTEAFHRAKAEGTFGRVAPSIERILFDDGGIRVWVRVLFEVLRAIEGDRLLEILVGAEDGEGVGRMAPHVVNVLDYFTGEGPLTATDQHPLLVGPHPGPIEATHRVLTRCNVTSTLAVLRKILELEVEIPNANGGVDVVPWIEPAFDALVDVAADPAFVALLETVELEDDEVGGGLRVGRDAFILIMRLVTGNIAADQFDLAYLRGLLNDVLVFQLPDETGARERLAHLLDVLEILVDPETEIFPFVQTFVQCVNAQDEDGAVPGMIYDYLTVDTLDAVEFLRDIDRLGDDAAGVPLREISIAVLGVLESTPALTGDAVRIGARFIEGETSQDTLSVAYALTKTDVVTDGLALLRAAIEGCGLVVGDELRP